MKGAGDRHRHRQAESPHHRNDQNAQQEKRAETAGRTGDHIERTHDNGLRHNEGRRHRDAQNKRRSFRAQTQHNRCMTRPVWFLRAAADCRSLPAGWEAQTPAGGGISWMSAVTTFVC